MCTEGRIIMKKIIKTSAAVLVTLAVAMPVFAAPTDTNTPSKFNDINTENYDWARPYIDSMAEKGLISGYEDGSYRPDNDVTRLEAISLFARAMGSVDKVNDEIIDIAHEKYDSVIENYDLKWGGDEVAYMMYKGALKKADLDTYLKGDEKDTPMKRYEAAIIITKAMGGEEEALADLGVVLDYTDAREVPSNAIQYVAYATEQGIMEGMGDGLFSPNTPVKRSQMAVMLSRTVDKTSYSFEKVKLLSVNTDTRTVEVTGADGAAKVYTYTDGTVMRSMGDETQPKDFAENIDVILTLSGETLVGIDSVAALPDETVRGKYVSYATTSGKTTLRMTDEEGETHSYECASDVSVTYEGSPATIRSFTNGDIITITLSNGKVASIMGETKATTISGAIVESLNVGNGITITISHGNSAYDGQTYDVSSDVSVKKNDATVGLDSIYAGDKVNLTLEYGVVTKIVATSTKKTVEGTIKSLTIESPRSTMVVKVGGEDVTYEIPSDVEILINGEEGSLYDFRVGDAVKLTVESEAITKIVATSTQESAGSVTGVVTDINKSFGFINVKPSGSETPIGVFCKDEQTTFVTADGKAKKMKDVKVGQTVEIKCTVSNGAYVGKLFVIVSE